MWHLLPICIVLTKIINETNNIWDNAIFERHTIAFTVLLDGRCMFDTPVTRSSQLAVVIKNSWYVRARVPHTPTGTISWRHPVTNTQFEEHQSFRSCAVDGWNIFLADVTSLRAVTAAANGDGDFSLQFTVWLQRQNKTVKKHHLLWCLLCFDGMRRRRRDAVMWVLTSAGERPSSETCADATVFRK